MSNSSKRVSKWIVPLFVFLSVTVVAAGNAAAQNQVATPNGRIVTGDTTGLTVAKVSPPLTVDVYVVSEEPVDLLAVPDPPPTSLSTKFWGYEAAATAARILSYDKAAAPAVHTGPDCVPPGSQNGRGLAMDPLDGNLWYTFVIPGFNGDGFIHKTNPPNTANPCTLVSSIPFGDGPGGTIQDDIGALDIDQGSKHIWAAGYKPVIVAGVARSYLYLVNRNNGSIIQSCWVPFGGGGVGNDTLAYFTDTTLPGSGQYLLTDAGEIVTVPNSLRVIDTAHCKNGAQVTPVTTYPKVVGMTGIEFEWQGLLATDSSTIYEAGGPPFSTVTVLGPAGTGDLEDLAYCGFRAKLGGGGNDHCPY